jgi:hypothetical protein
MSELLMTKPPHVRKARKGDCGTCHWFERAPNEPRAGAPWSGICLHNPPGVGQSMMQSALGGPPQAMLQGIHPPVSEIGRCHLWTEFRQYYDAKIVDGKDVGTDAA